MSMETDIKNIETNYNHFKTRHMDQLHMRVTCLGIVKAHDKGLIDDAFRDLLLLDPINAYNYPVMSQFITKALCGDIIHCNKNNSIDAFKDIHLHQKIAIYLRTKTWKQKREKCLELANYICSVCNVDFSDSKDWLHAHHIDQDYPTLYREDPSVDLKAECTNCHSKTHGHVWMYTIGHILAS